MEGFTYVDIFATKGIEYLLVIGFLLVFIPFWRFLSRPAKAIYEVAERLVPAVSEWFRLPEGIFYHQGHTWAIPDESNNIVKIGINDFAQKLIGKIDTIAAPAVGSSVIQGDKAWTLKVDSKSIDMLSPVDGEIMAVNDTLLHSPENINVDPYNSWLMKVKVPKMSANLKNLMSGQLAKRWIDDVRENLFSRMGYNLGTVYQDGGLPVDGMAKNLDREKWDEVVKELFLTS